MSRLKIVDPTILSKTHPFYLYRFKKGYSFDHLVAPAILTVVMSSADVTIYILYIKTHTQRDSVKSMKNVRKERDVNIIIILLTSKLTAFLNCYLNCRKFNLNFQ